MHPASVLRIAGLLLVLSHASAVAQSAESASSRVEEAKFIALGGIEQWVTIRGDDRKNPLLLYLHGGPAEPHSPFIEVYAPLERQYTLVQWDQRGSGRTYIRHGEQTPEVTLERMTLDVIDLAEQLQSQFTRVPIVLMGHSWGSFLGVHAIKRRPDLFAAFVGTGQVQSWQRTVELQYELTLERARAAGNQPVLDEIAAIGAPPYPDLAKYGALRKHLATYFSSSDGMWLQRQYQEYRNKFTAEDMKQLQAGGRFTFSRLSPVLMSLDLPAAGYDVAVPFFVIQGKEDLITPGKAAAEYIEKIKAPRKQMLWIDGAGHFALMTHTKQFVDALNAHVRPGLRSAK